MVPNDANPFYARDDIADRYNRSRVLPADVERSWGELIARHVGFRPTVCVDVGCGTGRFTRILSSTFHCRVVGVDPSRPMLRAAVDALGTTRGVSFLRGRAEALPLAPARSSLLTEAMRGTL